MITIHWQPLTPDNQQHIPVVFHHWLIDTGSLTTKLSHLCDQFSVRLMTQTSRVANPREIALLKLNVGDALIDREVQLYCNATPVVYARSLIPVSSVEGRFKQLDSMGDKPLGEVIFSDPQLDRSPLEWALLSPSHRLFSHAVENVSPVPEHLYGRRSLFYGAAKPIMISEFFLPEITRLMN